MLGLRNGKETFPHPQIEYVRGQLPAKAVVQPWWKKQRWQQACELEKLVGYGRVFIHNAIKFPFGPNSLPRKPAIHLKTQQVGLSLHRLNGCNHRVFLQSYLVELSG